MLDDLGLLSFLLGFGVGGRSCFNFLASISSTYIDVHINIHIHISTCISTPIALFKLFGVYCRSSTSASPAPSRRVRWQPRVEEEGLLDYLAPNPLGWRSRSPFKGALA